LFIGKAQRKAGGKVYGGSGFAHSAFFISNRDGDGHSFQSVLTILDEITISASKLYTKTIILPILA
jgi:hypothetical protein